MSDGLSGAPALAAVGEELGRTGRRLIVLDDAEGVLDGLAAVLPPLVHVFPGEGGITAMVLLAESHLTLHTFPEHGTLTANLYCCTERAAWPWEERVAEMFGAARVDVRTLARGGY